jgi:hypothetical protein
VLPDEDSPDLALGRAPEEDFFPPDEDKPDLALERAPEDGAPLLPPAPLDEDKPDLALTRVGAAGGDAAVLPPASLSCHAAKICCLAIPLVTPISCRSSLFSPLNVRPSTLFATTSALHSRNLPPWIESSQSATWSFVSSTKAGSAPAGSAGCGGCSTEAGMALGSCAARMRLFPKC